MNLIDVYFERGTLMYDDTQFFYTIMCDFEDEMLIIQENDVKTIEDYIALADKYLDYCKKVKIRPQYFFPEKEFTEQLRKLLTKPEMLVHKNEYMRAYSIDTDDEHIDKELVQSIHWYVRYMNKFRLLVREFCIDRFKQDKVQHNEDSSELNSPKYKGDYIKYLCRDLESYALKTEYSRLFSVQYDGTQSFGVRLLLIYLTQAVADYFFPNKKES